MDPNSPIAMPNQGWTKAEYDQCPELAGRLHDRILDLQDEVERLREALERETKFHLKQEDLRVTEVKRLREELLKVEPILVAADRVSRRGGHLLTEDNIIRTRNGGWTCRTCRRESSRRYEERKRVAALPSEEDR